jgi:hypothetical protein
MDIFVDEDRYSQSIQFDSVGCSLSFINIQQAIQIAVGIYLVFLAIDKPIK